jgi:Ca-activated chloride channel family protein
LLLVSEALEYGLASAETAFVAVRTEAGKPVEGTVPVANALPLGWSGHFLAPMGQYSLGTGALFAAAAPSARGIPSFLSRKVLRSPADAGTGARVASMGAIVAEAGKSPEPAVVFSGAPPFVGNEAVLFDSSRDQDADTLPESATIRLIQVRFPKGEPDADSLDPGLALVIFVGDLASPRAKVSLTDLVRRRGQRPLNISKGKGDVVRVVLVDPQGTWKEGAPKIEVALAW